jgi:hypothetical protein
MSSYYLKGIEFSLSKMKGILEMKGGKNYTSIQAYLILLNCAHQWLRW